MSSHVSRKVEQDAEVFKSGDHQVVTAFPAVTLEAYVKQVSIADLGKQQLSKFNRCFPSFGALGAARDSGLYYAVSKHGVFDLTKGRMRRFSGGLDLSGGRYFSICRDASGNDDGTLCFELMSYWDSTTRLFISMVDTTVHLQVTDQLRSKGWKVDSPLLVLSSSKLSSVMLSPRGDPVHGAQPSSQLLPIRLRHIKCDNVLDLRLPKAQDWLANESGKQFGEEVKFEHLLCSLMYPTPGGNEYHDQLGQWLRASGCMGFVYPSARRDVRVAASDQNVADSQGWNFVLYANAPACERPTGFPLPHPWIGNGRIGAEVYRADNGDLRIWVIDGVESAEWGRTFYEIRRARGLAPPPGPIFNPYIDGREKNSEMAMYFAPLNGA